MNLDIAFTAKQVCKITGIEYSTLDYWDRESVIKPSYAEGHGTGSKRLYTFKDIVAVKVAVSLKTQGVTTQSLRKVIAFLNEKFSEVEFSPEKGILVTDGKNVFEVLNNDEKEKLVDIISGGQIFWAVSMDKFVSRLERRAKRFSAVSVAIA